MTAFLLAALSIAQLTSPKLTFVTPAISLGSVIKEISTKAGVPVSADPNLLDIPLIISVHDVEPTELLNRIATIVDVKLIPFDQGYRLTRTATQDEDDKAAKLARDEEEWKDRLERNEKLVAANPWNAKFAEKLVEAHKKWQSSPTREEDFSKWQKESPRLNALEPGARLLLHLLVAIGPKQLAECTEQDHVVFSRTPNALQLPLKGNVDQWIKEYLSQVDQNPPQEIAASEEGSGDGSVEGWARPRLFNLQKVSGPIGKVLVIIDPIGAEIRIYNSTGLDGATARLSSFNLDFVADDESSTPDKPPFKVEGLTPLIPSALCQEELTYIRAVGDGGDEDSKSAIPTPSPALVSFLLNPETRDPLSLLPSEAMLSYAAQKKLNLVIRPEEGTSDLDYISDKDRLDIKSIDLNKYISDYGVYAGLTVKDNWVTADPNYVIPDMTRRTLGVFARSVAKQGPSLDSFCALMAGNNSGYLDTSYSPVFTYLKVSSGLDISGSDMDLAKFLGTLDATQRGALSRSGAISVRQVNSAQLKLLWTWLLSEHGSSSGVPDFGPTGVPPAETKKKPLYLAELTEFLPYGIPPDTYIQLTTTREDGFSADYDFQSIKQLAASHILSARNKEAASTEEDPGAESPYYHVMRSSHEVKLVLSKEAAETTFFNFDIRLSQQKLKLSDPAVSKLLKPVIASMQRLSTAELEKLAEG
ncbi:hypothetical protein BH11ARM1_BH11ARM1_00620 [soil metagenome]